MRNLSLGATLHKYQYIITTLGFFYGKWEKHGAYGKGAGMVIRNLKFKARFYYCSNIKLEVQKENYILLV